MLGGLEPAQGMAREPNRGVARPIVGRTARMTRPWRGLHDPASAPRMIHLLT